ncbi:MAG: cobalamin B12-binding domain-containing protein [bacterium]|nr:cobalamin B12-binding domain-containing protein [bacterium]
MNEKKRPRILVGKVGLDGHTTGIYAISKGLSDAGFEVIFGGIRLAPDQMANMALQEAVDAIGISILSGAHMTVTRKLLENLAEKGLQNLPVVIGGIVPPDDILELKKMGVRDVFIPGTMMSEIADRLFKIISTQEASPS